MAWHDMANRMLGVAVRTFSERNTDNEITVRYSPANGSPYDLVAVFDSASVSVDPNTGAQVSSVNPIIGVRLSDMSSLPAKGDRVTVRGIAYIVQPPQFDGVAGALLELKKA
jgi:hypothetical protein